MKPLKMLFERGQVDIITVVILSCLLPIGGLQIGGGITDENAQKWLDLGAEKVV
jgi:phosphoribosylformimino-5-aminoimidazole carboxamide ribonucleotide (ProFAR) isomerase